MIPDEFDIKKAVADVLEKSGLAEARACKMGQFEFLK
jgi:hypothetical protein